MFASFVISLTGMFLLGRGFGIRRTLDSFIDPSASEYLGAEGSVDVCLQIRSSHVWQVDGKVANTVQGQLVAFGDARKLDELPGVLVRCHMTPQWYLDVRDSGGEIWRYLYSLSGTKADEPQLQIGATLTIKFRAHWSFAKAAGFVVSDSAGPVLGVEQGEFGHGLAPSDLLPFFVRVADPIGLKREKCGDAVVNAVEIVGDKVVRVLPGQYGSVALGTMDFRFWNASSHDWINIRAMDVLGNMSWFLSRLQADRPSNKPLQQTGSPQ